MNYNQYKCRPNLILNLLQLLGAVEQKSIIRKLDYFPDFGLSDYDKFGFDNYFFSSAVKYPLEFHSLFSVSIENMSIFHYDDISRISDNTGIEMLEHMDFAEFITVAREQEPDVFKYEGRDVDIDGLRFNDVRVESINNIEKHFTVMGGYKAESDRIDPCDWSILIEYILTGIPDISTIGKFYVELLAEAYSLLLAGNFKLAYFMAFTALENYVNDKMDTEDVKDRFPDKVKKLLKSVFGDVSTHAIFTSIIHDLTDFEKTRNTIAHGREVIHMDSGGVKNVLVFVLTLIATSENKFHTFKDIIGQFEQPINATLT